MSGGYFNYNQYRFEDVAVDIEHLLETEMFKHDPQYEKLEVRFRLAVYTIRKAAIMAHRIDWLICGDDGAETFLTRWKQDLEKLKCE